MPTLEPLSLATYR